MSNLITAIIHTGEKMKDKIIKNSEEEFLKYNHLYRLKLPRLLEKMRKDSAYYKKFKEKAKKYGFM
jgi:hypothetical protein